jgi:Na+/H+ antiporter NhaD/arsenite permease-like protein
MNVAQIVASLLFGLGYLGIVLEHQAHVNKAAFALVMGGFLWAIVGIAAPEVGAVALAESSAEIFSIVVFLLAAMVLVEVLVHYRVFDYIQAKLYARNLGQGQQFWAMALLTFVLSAVLNNLTVTIVMIQIARKFFWGKNLLLAAAAIVVASNAGGAFSPVGDITTIMLWFADKFTATEILIGGFLPSLVLCLATTWLLKNKLTPPESTTHRAVVCKECPKLSQTDRTVVVTVLISFLLPVVARVVNVPPVLGILLGVGITWLVVDSFRQFTKEQTHLNASIEQFVQKTDIASIMFFIGVLLSVAAIDVLGILEYVSTWLYGSQGVAQVIVGNTVLGVLSGIFDNIPLTAMAISILETGETALWVLLAIAVGTGGSFFLVGSASGVVAAGMLPKLTFGKYLQLSFVPVLVGFVLAIAVWLAGYVLL